MLKRQHAICYMSENEQAQTPAIKLSVPHPTAQLRVTLARKGIAEPNVESAHTQLSVKPLSPFQMRDTS